MKKIICMLLAAIMLAFSLASCAKDPGGQTPDGTTTAAPDAPDTTAPESESVTNGLPPELLYKGETVAFVSRDADFVRDEVSVDEEDGDVIHTAITRRNSLIDRKSVV